MDDEERQKKGQVRLTVAVHGLVVAVKANLRHIPPLFLSIFPLCSQATQEVLYLTFGPLLVSTLKKLRRWAHKALALSLYWRCTSCTLA